MLSRDSLPLSGENFSAQLKISLAPPTPAPESVLIGPAEIALILIPFLPRSEDKYLTEDSRAAFATPITLQLGITFTDPPKLNVKIDKSVNKAIGITEIKEYLHKEKKLNEIKEKISIKTRQYAKRQSTWARGNMKNWFQLEPLDIEKFLKKIK